MFLTLTQTFNLNPNTELCKDDSSLLRGACVRGAMGGDGIHPVAYRGPSTSCGLGAVQVSPPSSDRR